ncbi:hypothetical protein [Streptomyces spectabilis]|uniref:Polyferredoxin n=1 Tax=Streptomyces spectabilis TaxID=68270 RepID=A0A5P2WZC4_STRST|nr:hypothetical protein [Streptomyces spectabilis]MBB5108827.1 polyferredoxin [Streptomyces spectabilis]MCI3899868.1 hypothetical protein [Streptomyces spectabilis]QEV57521.1 hypothetical protein CP982_01260 [Streptomyces spectabilis]GGV42364.1 hypothetical protein GCM10010245_66450 [Streptomyces spectabilis]
MSDSPSTNSSAATLYGPVSLGLGVAAATASVFSAYTGIAFALLAGVLAVTFGLLGLASGFKRNQSLAGLLIGSVGVVFFAVIVGGL